ncbi:MAG: adenylate/guanylate cyclase domain-containing protein [Pseudomonadota bacterium]|nr:adenylate/guanylate cyclase domain-containing protein [Pseudomonadota bacterium]
MPGRPASNVVPSAGGDAWLDCPPQLNSRLLKPLLRFYERQFGAERLRELVQRQGTTLEVLEDPDRWFSAALILSLNRAMVEATGDPDVIYRAGRALARPGMMGPERLLMRGLLTPRRVYESLGAITTRYSRITRWEMVSLGRGALRATFVGDPSAPDDLLFCGNRRGVLEAVPEVFGLPAAWVEHPRCVHRGDPRCEYEAHWLERPTWLRPALLAGGVLALASVAAWFAGAPAVTPWLAAASALFAALGLANAGPLGPRRGSDAPALTGTNAEELQDLLERNARRVQELQALQRVVEATRAVLDEDELVRAVLAQLSTALGYQRALLFRVDAPRGVLADVRSFGFGEQTARVEALELSLDPAGTDERLFGHVVRHGGTQLVTDVDEYAGHLLPQNREVLLSLRSRAFVVAPILGRGVPLGLLVVDRGVEPAEPLTIRDRDLLQAVGAAVGAALSNARLYRQVQEELLINRKFRQYLPAAVADDVRLHPEAALRLGGHEEDLAVMFCDVAGFTTTSASCEPEAVVRGLNAWFGISDPIIVRHGGIVDKRIGDGILVVFRADAGGRHPVTRAAEAALEMQRTLDAKRPRLRVEAPAFAEIRVRHAIHFGRVILGNVGTESRMEYTVIGDAVNTCARLEELTPAGEVWLTEESVRACGGLPGAVCVDEVVLRGRHTVTGLWALPVGPT